MIYKETKGDLIKLAKKGQFDLIAHGCNCFGMMGAGIALQMNKEFKVNKGLKYGGGHPNMLGTIQEHRRPIQLSKDVTLNLVIINAFTQYEPGPNIDYEALTLCMRKINIVYPNKHIGLPLIGAGIAGGNWSKIKKIILEELKDLKQVTIVIFKSDD